MCGHRGPAAGLTARQFDVVEMDPLDEPANRQTLLIGILDSKPQHELLFEKPGLDDFDIGELDAGILEIAAEPG